MLSTGFFSGFFFGPFRKTGNCFEFDRKSSAVLIFYKLLSMAINRFKYEGMPDSMDERFLELCLINSGKAGVTKLNGNVINYAAVINGGFNGFGYPSSITLFDYMGKSVGRYIPYLKGNEIEISDATIIYDNKTDVPPIYRIWWYANRLFLIEQAISTCLQNTRGAVVWETNSRAQTRAIERALKALDQGKPYIITYGDEENDLKDPPRLTTNIQSPELLMRLTEIKDKTYADFLTEFGINSNAVINKLAGVGDLELEQNEEAIGINREAALKMRQEGLDRINKMYGTSITVKASFTSFQKYDKIEEEEVEDNV